MKRALLLLLTFSCLLAETHAGLLDRLPFGKKAEMLAAEVERNDARLAINAVAWPLLTHDALLERCEGGRAAYGFARIGVEGIDMERKPAYDELGVAPRQILAVYDGSPAAHAGLRAGDVVTRFNGKRLKDGLKGDNKFTDLLEDARDDAEPIILDIEREGRALTLTIAPAMACDFEAIVGGALGLGGGHTLPRALRNRAITVDIALFRLVADDRDGIEAVILHELAHHFAGHIRSRALVSGIGRGLDVALGAVGGIATGGALGVAGGISFKASEEREADSLVLTLAADLGRDPSVYTALVRRVGAEQPELLASFVGAHPIDGDRLAALPSTEG